MKRRASTLLLVILIGSLTLGITHRVRANTLENYCKDKIAEMRRTNPDKLWEQPVPANDIGYKNVESIPLYMAEEAKCIHAQKPLVFF